MTDTKNESNWSKREKGAFWVKTSSRDNSQYMTGHIETEVDGKKMRLDLVVFPNKDSKNERAPDWRAYESNKTNSPPRNQTANATSGSYSQQGNSDDGDVL